MKNMKNKTGTILGITGFLVLLLSGMLFLGSPQAQQRGDPSAIVMAECTVCHTTGRICENLGENDRGEWTRTISEMVSKGADVPAQDIPAVVEYLAGLEPGSEPVCR